MLLSLDISSTSTGYAILDGHKLMYSGVLTSKHKDFIARGHELADKVQAIMQQHDIGFVVIEELKVLKNQKTLTILGIVNGMIIRELGDTPIDFIPPSVWRASYGLNGKREEAKQKAIALVSEKLKRNDISDDEAEAILLGKHYQKVMS